MNRCGKSVEDHGQVEGESVQKAWAEFKECIYILSTAMGVCGMRRRKDQEVGDLWTIQEKMAG